MPHRLGSDDSAAQNLLGWQDLKQGLLMSQARYPLPASHRVYRLWGLTLEYHLNSQVRFYYFWGMNWGQRHHFYPFWGKSQRHNRDQALLDLNSYPQRMKFRAEYLTPLQFLMSLGQ